jgi:hypothetical protein
MAPLLLWVAAVMVIYGVSYSNLQGLQGPLASLVRSSRWVLHAGLLHLVERGVQLLGGKSAC